MYLYLGRDYKPARGKPEQLTSFVWILPLSRTETDGS
jgi:hypothetical protein